MATAGLKLEAAGKRYLRQWLFRNLSIELNSGDHLAVTGLNGSGKSTLLQILAGYVSLTEGNILFYKEGKMTEAGDWYKSIAAATPYMELPEELSLREILEFYATHKPLRYNNPLECAEIAMLDKFMDRPVKFFSSGMKQRLKLSMALASDVPVILLDEPVSNLDQHGVTWFRTLLDTLSPEKMLIICSNNVEDEIRGCNKFIKL
jgi:ABC-type multidrug transport system ATPase subunit